MAQLIQLKKNDFVSFKQHSIINREPIKILNNAEIKKIGGKPCNDYILVMANEKLINTFKH